jgi:hypothetical protein
MEKLIRIEALLVRLVLCSILTLLLTLSAHAAGPFTVDITNDTHAVSPATSPNDGSGNVSLRSAIEAANAQAGPTTINLPSGLFNLSLGELAVAPNGTNNINIIGAGFASTTVAQADGTNRVFNIDANSVGGTVVVLSGLLVSGGQDAGDILGGAGILAGSVTSVPLDSLTVQDCKIDNNHCQAPNSSYTSQPGGGIQMAGGDLTVSGCVFSDNSSAASQGGAIAFVAPVLVNGGSGGTLIITNSIFSNNSLTNGSGSGPDGGGAVYINGTLPSVHSVSGCSFSSNSVVGTLGATFGGAVYLNTGTLNVDHSSFTGNSSAGQGALGGALYVDSGTLNMSFSRLAGNVATNGGSGVYNHASNSANTTAQNNWWGCNTGPTVAGCDQAASDGGSLNFAPWIILTNSASPNPILINQSTTLTASFGQNSAGDPLTPTNVSALIGLPITFDSAVLGALSSAQAVIQSDGTATATFTAGNSGGTGQANATADNGVATALITINQPPGVTTQPSDQAVCPGDSASFMAEASGVPTPSVQWQLSIDNGSTWTNVAGAVSTNLIVSGVTEAQSGQQYQAVFTNVAGSITSNPAMLSVNATPVAASDTLGTRVNTSVDAEVTNLLTNDSSPISGPLTLTSVISPSTGGGTVVLNGTTLTYTPPTNFIGNDSFTYILNDGRCSAQGIVNVTVTTGNGQTLNSISILVTSTNRVVQLAGIPANTYVVQSAPAADGPWTDFADGTLVADATGLITYTDSTTPAPPSRFYRTRTGP